VGAPGATEPVLGFQHDKALARALLLQMVGGADAGNTGAHDHHVKRLDGDLSFGPGFRSHDVHRHILPMHCPGA